MNDNQLKRMSEESEERIYELEEKIINGEPVSLGEIFRFNNPEEKINARKVIVPSFDEGRILTAYPYNDKVYFTVCPKCKCVSNPSLLRPLLETGDVIPILRAEYEFYDVNFIEEILGFPHIIMPEYKFFKKISLIEDAEGRLCPHCVGKKLDSIEESIDDDEVAIRSERIIDNLWPWISPDYELIDRLVKSVENRNFHLFSQIEDFSVTIRRLRDKQAYYATGSIPISNISNITKEDIENISGIESGDGVIEMKNTAAKAVGIEVPIDMDTESFIKTVEPNKEKLVEITDKIIEESKDGEVVSFDKLREETERINNEIRSAFGSTKFKAYKTTKQTVSSNKTLVATMILGGLFGAVESFTGCGLTVAGGAGIKGVQKYTDLKKPNSLKEVGSVMHNKLEPAVNSVLSKYLGIDLRSVEVWRLREEMTVE
jgi:hypothetical protein